MADQANYLKELNNHYDTLKQKYQELHSIEMSIILIKLTLLFHKKEKSQTYFTELSNDYNFEQFQQLGTDFLLNFLLLYAREQNTLQQKNMEFLKQGIKFLCKNNYITECFDYILECQEFSLLLEIKDDINQLNFYNYAISCIKYDKDYKNQNKQLQQLYNIFYQLHQSYICLDIGIKLHNVDFINQVKQQLIDDQCKMDAFNYTVSRLTWYKDNIQFQDDKNKFYQLNPYNQIYPSDIDPYPLKPSEISNKKDLEIDWHKFQNNGFENEMMQSLVNCMSSKQALYNVSQPEKLTMDYTLLLAAHFFNIKAKAPINFCLSFLNSKQIYIQAAGCLILGLNYRLTGDNTVIKILIKYANPYYNQKIPTSNEMKSQNSEEQICRNSCALLAIGLVCFGKQNQLANRVLIDLIQKSVNQKIILDKLSRASVSVALAMNNVGTGDKTCQQTITRLIAGLSLNQRGVRFFPLIASSIYLLYNTFTPYDESVLENIFQTLNEVKECDNREEKLTANDQDNFLLFSAMQTYLACQCNRDINGNLEALIETIQGRVAAEEAQNSQKLLDKNKTSEREAEIRDSLVQAGIPIFVGEKCVWWSESQDVSLPLVMSQAQRDIALSLKDYANRQKTQMDTDSFTKFELQQRKYEILHLYQDLQLYGNELTKRAAPLMLGLCLNQTADQTLLPHLISQATNIDQTISFNSIFAIALIFAGSQDKKAIQAINYIMESKFYTEQTPTLTFFIRKIALGLIMLGQGHARLNLDDINRYNLLILLLQFIGGSSEVMQRSKSQLFLFLIYLLVEPKWSDKELQNLYENDNADNDDNEDNNEDNSENIYE